MSEKITFKELVEKISTTTNQSEQTTNSFIHELTTIIESGLKEGEKISISGFGKFELRWMNQRKGRHPQTGEKLTIPGQNRIVFKPFEALRNHVNLPYEHLDSHLEQESNESELPLPEEMNIVPAALFAFSDPDGKNDKGPGESDEDIDDWIRERPSPVKNKASAARTEKNEPHEDSPVRIGDTEGKKTATSGINKKRKKRKYKWSYTVASAIILIGIILLFILIFWPREIAEQTTPDLTDQSETEQTLPPVSVSPSPSATDEEPPVADPSTEVAELPVMGVHSVLEGDSFWAIAESTYGNPYLWPIIYHSNRNDVDNPNQIIAGGSLDLPEIQDPGNLTQNEIDIVARGYLYVYDWMTVHQPGSARYFLWAVGFYSQELLQRVSDRVDQNDLTFATQR